MVTIRNDIESNGSANRAPDGTAVGGAVGGAGDGVKNVNHLANGSRRSTMADLKPKTFNRTCVGFLALIVCVSVCFGVGMLFLYGHLCDRLEQSATAGSMLYDKNGNPVRPVPTTTVGTTAPPFSTTTTTTGAPMSTSTSTERPTTVTVSPTTTTTSTTQASRSSIDDDLDYWLPSSTSDSSSSVTDPKDTKGAPTVSIPEGPPRPPSRHPYDYDDEDADGSGHSSGTGSGDYENDEPYQGSGNARSFRKSDASSQRRLAGKVSDDDYANDQPYEGSGNARPQRRRVEKVFWQSRHR